MSQPQHRSPLSSFQTTLAALALLIHAGDSLQLVPADRIKKEDIATDLVI